MFNDNKIFKEIVSVCYTNDFAERNSQFFRNLFLEDGRLSNKAIFHKQRIKTIRVFLYSLIMIQQKFGSIFFKINFVRKSIFKRVFCRNIILLQN